MTHTEGDRAGMSALSQLRFWLQAPAVIADPEQVDPDTGRVWSHARDVLPNVLIRPGEAVVAAWENVTWLAIPEWDDLELDSLWLRPVGKPVTAADVAGPAAGFGDGTTMRSADNAGAGAGAGAWNEQESSDLVSVDVVAALAALVVETAQLHRSIAQDVLVELADLPAKHQRRLRQSAALGRLLQLARRPALPSLRES